MTQQYSIGDVLTIGMLAHSLWNGRNVTYKGEVNNHPLLIKVEYQSREYVISRAYVTLTTPKTKEQRILDKISFLYKTPYKCKSSSILKGI